jgi:hypothetical protein
MAIIVAEEKVFPLADTPKHIPSRPGGKRLHKSTAFRWRNPGVRGERLETIRIGGTLYTSAEALQRFFERLSATDLSTAIDRPTAPTAPLARRAAAARRRAEEADRKLEALGVGL